MPFIARVIVSDGWSIEVISTVENNAESVTTVLFRLYGRVFVSLGNNNERCYLLLVITVRTPQPCPGHFNESTLSLCPEANRLQIIVGNLG